MAYVNPFISGQLFDPEANRKVGRLVPDGYQTGVLGQAQSFASEQQAKQQAEIAANQQAQQQAQQLQQQIEAEAARQEQLRERERDDAYRLEQDRLTQSRFTQQQDIQQKQFDAQLKLLNQQEAMRQAQQMIDSQRSARGTSALRDPYNGVPMSDYDRFNLQNSIDFGWAYSPIGGGRTIPFGSAPTARNPDGSPFAYQGARVNPYLGSNG